MFLSKNVSNLLTSVAECQGQYCQIIAYVDISTFWPPLKNSDFLSVKLQWRISFSHRNRSSFAAYVVHEELDDNDDI